MQAPHKGGLLTNNLVFRYNVDEVDDGQTSARLIFEQMLGYANHVGMYS